MVGRRVGMVAIALSALVAGMVPAVGASAAAAAPGAWTVSPTPKLAGHATLSAVACANASTCFAVGRLGDTLQPTALIEQWDGAHWKRVPTPAPRGRDLNGVACPSATNCVAVGAQRKGEDPHTVLIETWNGSSWTITPSAGVNVNIFDNVLSAVSCSSVGRCGAVGVNLDMHNYMHPIVARLDGSTWTGTYGPSPAGLGDSSLTGVSCAATNRCEAVGETEAASAAQESPLVVGWNGHAWKLQTPDNPGDVERTLIAVSCASVRNCLAVGREYLSLMAEAWDGSSWSLVTPAQPDPDWGVPYFRGVACPQASRCVAVGVASSQGGSQTPLIERAHGPNWSIVTPPDTGGPMDSLMGVACASTSLCFAVGIHTDAGGYSPIILTGSA